MTGTLRCEHLPSGPAKGAGPATIELHGPEDAENIVLSKTGVVVRFSRTDFITVATCRKHDEALKYIHAETGGRAEAPLRDAYQLSYIAATLLDLGRASVKLRNEKQFRPTILREPWSAPGCAGSCRSTGRLYKLSAADPLFFLRVTDETADVAR